MGSFLILLFFLFIFLLVVVLSVVSHVLGGVFRLLGFGRSQNAYSSNNNGGQENDSESNFDVSRSEVGAKRMKVFKEKAESVEFVEEKE